MFQSFKDIVLAVRLALNPASAQQVQSQIQQTLANATNSPAATKNIGGMTGSVMGLARSIRLLGVTIGTYLGGRVLLNFIRGATEEFLKFDRALQSSLAVLEKVDANMRKQLGDTALQVSRELNMSAEDLAKAYYFLASAGYNAEQSIKALPAVALFAKAGMMDLQKATEILTQAQAALGLRLEDPVENLGQMVRLMDAISAGANESQATIEEFTDALTNKSGASLRLFNKDAEEGLAILAVFADQGIKGRIAGERLDIFIRQVTQAAIKHKEVFKQYGIEVFDATTGRMKNFADIAEDLTNALGGLSDEQQVVALQQLGFQVRTVAVVKSVIGMQDEIRKYEKLMREANGTTRTMADEIMKSWAERLGIIKQKFSEAKIELGEKLVPVLEHFASVAGDESNPNSVINILRALVGWLGSGAPGTGAWGLTKILGVLITILMETVNAFHMIADALVVVVNVGLIGFGAATTFAAAVTGTFLEVLGDLASWIGFDTIGKKFDGLGKKVVDFANKAARFTGGRVENIVTNTMDLYTRLTQESNTTGLGARGRPGNLTQGLRGGGGIGRPDRTGSALTTDAETAEDQKKAADRRTEQENNLLERLRSMRAKFNAEDTESNLERLRQLEHDFNEFYGTKMPEAVRSGLDEIIALVKDEDAARVMATVFDDLYEDAEPTAENIAKIQAYIDRLEALRDTTVEGSSAWEEYSKSIAKATDKIKDLSKELKKQGDEIEEERQREEDDFRKARLERIARVGEKVAERVTDAFGNFFNVLFTGSKRGVDAFEALGRGILAAIAGSIGDFAQVKAKKAFTEAAEEAAYGWAAMANPITRAQAPLHFKAAAQFAAVGAMWSALAGAGGMGASSIRAGTHGLGRVNPSRDIGGRRVDDASRMGPDIHIFIDGVDPSNPRHQNLLGNTIAEYRERTGGNLLVSRRP